MAEVCVNEGEEVLQALTVTVGATVPTGFEHTAAEEVQEKIGASARVSKDRGRIYFEITSDHLHKVSVSQLTVSALQLVTVFPFH